MYRLIGIAAIAGWLLSGSPLLAQDDNEQEAATENASSEPQTSDDGDEESFTPTEAVEADTAVAFPTDI